MSGKTVKPELIGGTRDLLPREALALQRITATIKSVYESFGFVPLETPCLERRSVLTGDDENFNKSIFSARVVRGAEDKNIDAAQLAGDDSALRFDLTVPLARVVAAYPELPRPFKRYQIGKVFRGEQPQAGRFREFFQFDFDIIGSSSILADVETIQVMYEAMKALSIPRFLIRFNSRRILTGLTEMTGRLDRAKDILRIIDKIDKLGPDGVLEELHRQPVNRYDESAIAMSQEGVDMVKRFLQIRGDNPDAILQELRDFFAETKGNGLKGIIEVEEIISRLRALGIPPEHWQFDLSVARGLDYYTGPVFETYLTDMPELGSVFSGGRFDGLTDRFIPGSNIAGVGASVGIDRLIVGLDKLGLLETSQSPSRVLVTIFNEQLQSESALFAADLRRQGCNVELYLGDDPTLRAQFAYAAKMDIPFAVVIGPEEAEQGNVQLKDMVTRKQEALTREECSARIRAS